MVEKITGMNIKISVNFLQKTQIKFLSSSMGVRIDHLLEVLLRHQEIMVIRYNRNRPKQLFHLHPLPYRVASKTLQFAVWAFDKQEQSSI